MYTKKCKNVRENFEEFNSEAAFDIRYINLIFVNIEFNFFSGTFITNFRLVLMILNKKPLNEKSSPVKWLLNK